MKLQPIVNHNHKFDFGAEYKQLYSEYKKEQKVRRRNNDTVKWVQNQRNIYECDLLNDECTDHRINPNYEIVSKFDFSGTDKTIKPKKLCESVNTNSGIVAPIWCMDYFDNLIVIGCADGSLEFWEGTTGKFRVSLYLFTYN